MDLHLPKTVTDQKPVHWRYCASCDTQYRQCTQNICAIPVLFQLPLLSMTYTQCKGSPGRCTSCWFGENITGASDNAIHFLFHCLHTVWHFRESKVKMNTRWLHLSIWWHQDTRDWHDASGVAKWLRHWTRDRELLGSYPSLVSLRLSQSGRVQCLVIWMRQEGEIPRATDMQSEIARQQQKSVDIPPTLGLGHTTSCELRCEKDDISYCRGGHTTSDSRAGGASGERRECFQYIYIVAHRSSGVF